MGSMGLLLADWSVELFRARRKKAKKAKMMEKMERVERVAKVEEEEMADVVEEVERVEIEAGKNTEKIVTSREVETSTGNGGFLCLDCEKLGTSLEDAKAAREELAKREERLGHLVGVEPEDLIAAVEELVSKAAHLRTELEQVRAEGRTMAERVGRQLGDRDNAHAEKVEALETLMAEKEKQLLQSSNLLRQQLAHGKKEREALQRQLDEKISANNSSSTSSTTNTTSSSSFSSNWEAECNSLKLVLEIRREEAEQLKAANNSLRLELERFQGLETQLQVQKQRAEELGLVVAMKNDQLRQVLDEYDSVQQQLEVEVSAHLACQQELERSQWVAESILSPAQQSPAREKTWKNLSNQVESGLILDVVQKGEKGLAYSFNC